MSTTTPEHTITSGFNLNRIAWVTASVTTENSTYLVVARPEFGVRMIVTRTTGQRSSYAPQLGETYSGVVLLHAGTTLHLMDEQGYPALRTSRVTHVHVFEN